MTAAQQIIKERRRQMNQEKYSLVHDDEHKNQELARAGKCYIDHAVAFGWMSGSNQYRSEPPPILWPWAKKYWKPKDKVRDYIRGAALIAAEIDRLQRLES